MMAYTILLRNITPTQQQNIRPYRGYGNSAELAYNHLKNLYQATDSVNQSRLMAQLTTIEMKPGEKGMEYISRCRELRDRLLRCGERTRALATIQHSTAAETTSTAAETSSAAAETSSAAAETTTTAAETSSAAAETTSAAAAGTTTPVLVDEEPPTPAQQLKPTPREAHRSANFVASFYSNSDTYRRSPGHRASEETWHARLGHPSNTVLNNTIRAGVLDKDSLLLPDGKELQKARGTCLTCPEADLPHRPFAPHHNPSAPAYAPLEKVYSDILYNREPGQVAYNYTITFIDAATRYVWHLNLPSRDMALAAFAAWLPVAERESGAQLKSFQSDGGGEYTSQRFKQYLAERGIKQLLSLPYAHQ
ncbi:unnamed protein product [Closterium sp. NIES-65]|nr:unnamed protein product [Closterium sp. NIES-65]